MNNTKITDIIKFETNDFADRCFEIYKNCIDKNIQKTYDLIYNKIEIEIKKNIMQKLGGDELFDHSDIEEITDFELLDIHNKVVKIDSLNDLKKFLFDTTYLQGNPNNWYEQNKKNIDLFFNFAKGEKIIVSDCKIYHCHNMLKRCDDGKCIPKHVNSLCFVTNYAKLLRIVYKN
jgi:hypothetical protein